MRSRPCKHTSSPVMPCLEAAAAAAVAALAAAAHRPLKQPENEEETVCHGCGLRGLANNQPTTTAATPTGKQGDVALGADGQHTGQPLAVVAAPLHLDLVQGGIGQMWGASEGAMGKCRACQARGNGPATCRRRRASCAGRTARLGEVLQAVRPWPIPPPNTQQNSNMLLKNQTAHLGEVLHAVRVGQQVALPRLLPQHHKA